MRHDGLFSKSSQHITGNEKDPGRFCSNMIVFLHFFSEEQSSLQKVPPIKETAEKFHRHFLRGSARHVHPLWYTRDRKNKYGRTPRGIFDSNDVVFIVDASGSIKEREFYEALEALDYLVTIARASTKYALMTFSEEVDVMTYFRWPPWKIRTILKDSKYIGYRTNTSDALIKCRKQLFMNQSWSRVRRNSLKSVLVITDGRSNVNDDLTLYWATKLKALDVEIFVVAVGKYIRGINELIGMATSKERHLFRVEAMDGLIQVIKLIPPKIPRQYSILDEYFKDGYDSR